MKLGAVPLWVRGITAGAVGIGAIVAPQMLSPRPVSADSCHKIYLPMVMGGAGLPPSNDNVLVFQCNEPVEPPNPTHPPYLSPTPQATWTQYWPSPTASEWPTNGADDPNPIELTPNVGSTSASTNADAPTSIGTGDASVGTADVRVTPNGTPPAIATNEFSVLNKRHVVIFEPDYSHR